MDDLIRRSDAIEAIEVVDWYHQNRNKEMVSGANDAEHQAWYKADDVYKALEAVPSTDRPQGDSVSRRYLLAEIDDLVDEFSEVDENGLHGERWCGILDSKGIIVNAPSVSDRPSGEWIEFDTKWGRSLYYCTNCMETSEVPTVFGNPLYDFCPNCGADMRERESE